MNDFCLPDGCDWLYVPLDCSPQVKRHPLPVGAEDFDIKGIAEYSDGHWETFLSVPVHNG